MITTPTDPTELYFDFDRMDRRSDRPLTQGVQPVFRGAVIGPNQTTVAFFLPLTEKGLPEDQVVFMKLKKPATEISDIFTRRGFNTPRTEPQPIKRLAKTIWMHLRT